MKNSILLIILTFTILSCQQKSNKALRMTGYEGNVSDEMEIFEESAPVTMQSEQTLPALAEPQPVNKKKIIKDGRMGLQVSDLEKARQKIDTLVKKYNAYYANESFSNTSRESIYNLKIRIPSDNFERFVLDIEKGEGDIQYKDIDARDVTDQFIDLETRLKSKKSYLNRYHELLRKAIAIKEILEVEEKIRILEEEIESTTGRLNYLSDQVDYSTLNLIISQENDFQYKPESRSRFSEKLKQSISKGWYGFVDFSLFLIRFWPFIIVVFFFISLWRWIKRKKKSIKDKMS